MRILIFALFLTSISFSNTLALFGEVVNVASNDTLNVRIKPNYKSKKIAHLPLGAVIGIDRCIKKGRSKWCKTYPITDFDTSYSSGWVNARYLKFRNRGYVNIIGKESNCLYSIKCNKGRCLIVYDLNYNYDLDKMVSIKTKWIDRKKLKGASKFSAISKNSNGGYCTTGEMIKKYLKKGLK